jgi:TRAP-type C4-dicarboxylate transport system, periplasmic component
MNRRSWILGCVVTIILLALAGLLFRPTFSSFMTSDIQLKVGWPGSEKSGKGLAIADYQKELKKIGVDIDLSLFSAERLGENIAVLEQIRLGQSYMAFMSVHEGAKYSDKVKALSVPFLFQNNEEIAAFMASEAGEAVKQELAEKGFQVVGWLAVSPDPLWLGEPMGFPEDLKNLKTGIIGSGYEADFWRGYEMRVQALPQGIWRNELVSQNINSLVVSSEWMETTGLFWRFPQRIVIGGVKPEFLVVNQELFLSLSENTQKGLMDSTEIWQSEWSAERLETANFNLMASQTTMSTYLIPVEEYREIAEAFYRKLPAEEQKYLDEVRSVIGGYFFYEPKPARQEERLLSVAEEDVEESGSVNSSTVGSETLGVQQ